MASGRKKQDEKNLKLLRDLAAQPHNKVCFDCGQRGPTYVNMTIGSFVCTSCSGILRGLNPPHRVKSISMTSFTQQEIETLQGQGNEYCRKVWLGLWNSSMPAEPESRDEQKKKDFMVQKYERKRWYVAPQQVSASNTSQSTPEPKPLKQLLGENAPTISVHAQTTRERPRTGSQTNSTSVPVSVAPPPGQVQPVAHQVVAQPAQPVQVQAPIPAPQAKPPSIDLLSDLGGDPFDQTQTQGQFATTPQFDAFGAQPTATSQNTFDPFGSTAPQPAQPTESGFATFGAPPQQQPPNFFDAFGSPPSSSGGFNAFAAQTSTASSQPQAVSNSGFGPLVSASGSSASTADKYAALSGLDGLFASSVGGSSNTSISSASGFGSTGTSSFGMSSGPNPFSSTSGAGSGGFQQAQQQPSNPFQGLGGQLNGPTRNMSTASSMSSTSGVGGGFGSFNSAPPMGSAFGNQPATSGFGNQPATSGFGNQPATSGFGNQPATSGFGSQPATSGFGNQPATSGFGNQPATSGFGNQPATSGFGSQPATSGFGNQPATSGFGNQPATSGFGNQPATSGFGNQPATSGFGAQQPNSGFAGANQIGGGFGNFVSGQQSSYGAAPQPGWGGMSGQQQMVGGQNVGMASSSPQQTLSFGGAGMSAMAWTQFGKMGGSQQQPQQPQIQSQMNFGGNQTGFAGNSAFGAAQSNAGFGSNAMSSGNSFGGQQQVAGFGTSGSFGGQPSSGFGNQGGGGSFGGSMSMMGAGQSGQQQQLQQFGSWQQSQQANPFMNARAQGIQRQGQSTNPFM
ncbi:LOW QUALITY PROTEIN: arf-GAP domain and FG repeat-containing protein 1-like [Acropora millepora]|uniref:LOW QUALITY PROTEIN: arf-GAP domain and FG repeat-containing protein 1-like n=1 Tax=Acropora millepora TaxID=45264 RepID=UPI001CF5748E|nr:LOW QUALITY PROTEIN: arf-GAP domain and FG repeat-containing protein 1-like [Acropora millepora]